MKQVNCSSCKTEMQVEDDAPVNQCLCADCYRSLKEDWHRGKPYGDLPVVLAATPSEEN